MSLVRELKIQTIVFLANKAQPFNPPEFNQYWLDVNNVISANDIASGSNFTPNGVAVVSGKMNLVVIPEQLQVSCPENESFKDIATIKCSSILKNISEVSFRGMGINFTWFLYDSNSKITDLTKALFKNPQAEITKKFDQDDSKYGLYLSKDVAEHVRLKLDIKPVTLTNVDTGKKNEYVQCAFNFHSDLNTENQTELALEILNRFDDWKNIAEELVNSINTK